jgi:isoleucyl-tRNA synthetase
MLRMSIKEYDFEKLWCDKIKRRNKHATCEIHYYDNTTKTEFDLHRPYIDNVRFMIDGKKYTRIPEVLDCRFES